jgi:WD40 repeat protein
MVTPIRQSDIFLPGDSSPSFTFLAGSSSSFGSTLTSDGQLLLFDSSTAQIISSIQAHSACPTGLDLNENSQLIHTCCDKGSGNSGNEVSLWDIRSSNLICTFAAASYVQYSTRCQCVASSHSGTVVGAGTKHGIIFWDIRKPEGLFQHINIQPDEIASLQFHPTVTGTFVAGDDDGNLLVYDLDGNSEENSILLYQNDQNPVFQCGFIGVGSVFSLSRTAALKVWKIMDSENVLTFEDVRAAAEDAFGYPIDGHGIGDGVCIAGGDSEGGVAIVNCSGETAQVFTKIEKANRDCVNATYLEISGGNGRLWLAGDGGHLSFWQW